MLTWSKIPNGSLVMLPLLPIGFGMPYIRRIVSGNLKLLGRRTNPQSPSQARCSRNIRLRRGKHAWRRGFSTGSSRACTHRYRHTYAWSTLTKPREPGYVNLSHRWVNSSDVTQAPNLQCFIDRAGAHPDRLQQIYFNTVLLLRAVSRLGPYLSAYDYCSTGTHEEDAHTKTLLGTIINIAHQVGKFDEKLMFAGEDANASQDRSSGDPLTHDCP